MTTINPTALTFTDAAHLDAVSTHLTSTVRHNLEYAPDLVDLSMISITVAPNNCARIKIMFEGTSMEQAEEMFDAMIDGGLAGSVEFDDESQCDIFDRPDLEVRNGFTHLSFLTQPGAINFKGWWT